MKRCEANEHVYDDDMYPECPYCRDTYPDSEWPDRTIDDKTEPFNRDSDKTIVKGITGKGGAVIEEPVVGWLVIVKGAGKGKDIRIFPGMNSIGRQDADIKINFGDNMISRKDHAFLIYDPKSNKFSLKHGGGKNLTYLNNELVFDLKQLEAYDILHIGETELVFMPFCSEKFQWGNNDQAATEAE